MPVLGLDADFFNNEDEAYVNCVKLWDLARTLCINTMMAECLKQLVKLLQKKVVSYQHLYCNVVDVPAQYMAGLKAGVQLAYEKDIKPMKEFFVNFVEDTHFWVIEEDQFKEILAAVPKFAEDFDAKIPTLIREGDYRPYSTPISCVVCSRTALDQDNHWAMLTGDDGDTAGTCYRCWQQLDPDDSSDDDYE